MRLPEFIQDRIERQRDRNFLKAAMAASALTAYADGKVSVAERYKVEEVLDHLQRLHIYDTDKALQKFEEYVRALERDVDSAAPVLLGKLSRMAGNREAAELIALIAIDISEADEYVNRAERLQFDEICAALDLDPTAYQ